MDNSKSKGRTGPKRTTAQRAEDLVFIAGLYKEGYPVTHIAQMLSDKRLYNLSNVTIANDLRKVRKQWIKQSTHSFDERVAIELAKIDNLELIAHQGWQRSLNSKKVTTQKRHKSSSSEYGEETIVETAQAGDPRFLAEIGKCIERRMKLFGLAAPVGVDLTSGGRKLTVTEVVYRVPEWDEKGYGEKE